MSTITANQVLDTSGLMCPMPIVKAKKAFDTLPAGEVLEVISTDRGSMVDFQSWAKSNKAAELLAQETSTDAAGKAIYLHYLRRK